MYLFWIIIWFTHTPKFKTKQQMARSNIEKSTVPITFKMHIFKKTIIIRLQHQKGLCSSDNVAVSDFLNFDISGRRLQLHRISAMAQQRGWFTPAVFRTFPTSYMKNNCMKNSLNFLKTVWCNKILKTTFVNAIIPVSYTHLTLPTICSW